MRPWTLLFVVLLASVAAGDTAEQTYTRIYGGQTRGLTSNAKKLEFARQLIKDADGVQDDPGLQALLYQKAYDYAMASPEGYRDAADAMEKLGTAQPKLKPAADEKRLAVFEKQLHGGTVAGRKSAAEKYLDSLSEIAERRADAGELDSAISLYQKAQSPAALLGRDREAEVADEMKSLRARQSAARRAAVLRDKLQKSPADTAAATELVRLLLLELNRPREAAGYVDHVDAALRTPAALAVRPADSLSDTESLQLAHWYQDQARAPDADATLAESNARRLYEQFLAEHTKEDAARLDAVTALKQLESADARRHVRHVDLLAAVEIPRDVLSGTWKAQGDGVAVDKPPRDQSAILLVPYVPPEEYDLQYSFTPGAGHTGVGVAIPKGDATVVWQMGHTLEGKVRAGFDLVDNENIAHNKTGVVDAIQVGRTYGVVIQVRRRGIRAIVDGRVLADLATDGKNLSRWRGYPAAIGKNIALLSGDRPAVFESVFVTELSGPGKPTTRPTK